MNEDELEHELTRLRPALPPDEYLRRLRADPPMAAAPWYWGFRTGLTPPWAAAGAGLLAAAALLLWPARIHFSSTPTHVPGHPTQKLANGESRRSSTAVLGMLPDFEHDPGKTGTAHAAGPWSGGSLDFSRLRALPGGSYAMLGGDRPAPASGYDLDTPVGPMRLDCGLLSGGDPDAFIFGRFDLPSNQPF